MSYQTVKDVLNLAIKQEEKLNDFYDVAEYAVKDNKSKESLIIIRVNLERRIEIMKNININMLNKMEWLKNIPDTEEYISFSIKEITRNSTPEEIFSHILKFEEKQEKFYIEIKDSLKEGDTKDFFDSMVKFKAQQLIQLKMVMDDFNIK